MNARRCWELGKRNYATSRYRTAQAYFNAALSLLTEDDDPWIEIESRKLLGSAEVRAGDREPILPSRVIKLESNELSELGIEVKDSLDLDYEARTDVPGFGASKGLARTRVYQIPNA